MKAILVILVFAFGGCTVGQYQQVVSPIDAVKLCGMTGVVSYSALSGNIVCNKVRAQ